VKYGSLLLLAGCNKLFDLTAVGPLPDAADAPPDSARFSCQQPLLIDEFTDSAPCAPWGELVPSGMVVATDGNMMLVLELSNMGEAQCRTPAGTGIALPAGGLVVQAAQVPAGSTSYMALSSTALDLELYEQSGMLFFAHAGGSPVFGSIQYNAAEMQFWRIDPLPTMTANASYSSDGITWIKFATGSFTPPTPPIDIKIKAGAFNIGAPTQAIFEHLLACP
jgi:hypothetical protein